MNFILALIVIVIITNLIIKTSGEIKKMMWYLLFSVIIFLLVMIVKLFEIIYIVDLGFIEGALFLIFILLLFIGVSTMKYKIDDMINNRIKDHNNKLKKKKS